MDAEEERITDRKATNKKEILIMQLLCGDMSNAKKLKEYKRKIQIETLNMLNSKGGPRSVGLLKEGANN